MSYAPVLPLDHPTTTERLSGRSVDGTVTYIKLIKQSGAMGTGNLDIAHGITGLARIIGIRGGCHIDDGRELQIPYSNGSTPFILSCRGFGTTNNIRLNIGTGWTSTLALSDAWLVIEYQK